MASRDLSIKTADGVAPASLFGSGTSGVILYMDAFGPRPALYDMAERLSGDGYAVLVPDLFYRAEPYGPFDAKTAFANEATGGAIRQMMSATTQALTQQDTGYFLQALSAAGVTGPIGTVGYCMGGARAINAAAAYPERIVAAASFHGGNLASDAADSPHRQVSSLKGRVYVGVAGVDRSFPPEQSAKLAEALRSAEIDHIIENYVGKAHGWAVPDHSVFDHEGAERHWARLTTFFRETLSPAG